MPTKSRTIPITTPWVYQQDGYNNANFGTPTWTSPSNYNRLVESIEFENGKKRFNNCLHTRLEDEILHNYLEFPTYPSTGWWTRGTAWGMQSTSVSGGNPTGAIWTPADMLNRQYELWQRIKPTMESGFSLLNFVYELKDFKSLFRRISGKINVWKNLLKDLYDPKLSLRMNLHKLHLSYSFAWAPLVGDLTKVIKAMRTFERRYNAVIRGASKPVLRRAAMQPESPPWQETYNHSGGGGQKTVRSYTFIHAPKLTMVAKFYYSLPSLGMRGKLNALLDSLGVNLNPEILWNAIPFSFVADWFTNVGDYLGQFGEQQFKIPVTPISIGYSYKFSYSMKATNYYGTQLRTVPVRLQRYSYYRRWRERAFPTSIAFSGGLPSLNQGLLALSLISVLTKPKSR